jgi:Beta-lactamase
MGELDDVINNAVAAHDAPFLVAMVGKSDGATWSGTAGDSTVDQPAALDTVFRIFSMTKAVGSTAAMILIERGRLSFTPLSADVNLFGLIMTQSLPFADPRFMATYEQFEQAAYRSLV